jgi:predicted molibdopterin-dependent oxidoreductase YjgC
MFRKLHEPADPAVTMSIDGVSVRAEVGESVAAVLLRNEPFHARESPTGCGKRAPYCLMGICFECLVIVDGTTTVRACTVVARDGMRIERKRGGASGR